MSRAHVEVAGESDIGLVRERNEDVLLAVDLSEDHRYSEGVDRYTVGDKGVVLSVFDGMGGAMAGDRASELASQVVAEKMASSTYETAEDLGSVLATSLLQANDRIRQEGRSNPDCVGMGTTATVAMVVEQMLVIAHVGDSRAYLLRDDKLVQLTEDQSLYNELLSSGKMEADEAAEYQHSNVILQALGVSGSLTPYFARVPLQRGDLLLLCTDGLTALAPDEAILEVLSAGEKDLGALTAALTELARVHGGYDNTTVVLARFEPEELEGEQGEPPESEGEGGAAVEIVTFEPPSMTALRRRRIRLRLLGTVAVILVLILALAGLVILLGTFPNLG